MLSIQEFLSLPYIQKMQKIIFILSEFETKKAQTLVDTIRTDADYPENKLIKLYNAIFDMIQAKRKEMREKQQAKLENIRLTEDTSMKNNTGIDWLLQLI